MSDPTSKTATFTTEEVRISNIQIWNRAIDHCKAIVDQVAADYEQTGSAVTGRQMRCVSLLLMHEKKSDAEIEPVTDRNQGG